MYNILIIDDEEPLREAIRLLGKWKELQVDHIWEAENGLQGMAVLAERKIDVIMVDMNMPEMNGVEFLQKLENDYPEMLTIVISGYNDFEYTRQAIRSKVVDYLLKPINRHDLNQALTKAIDLLEAKRKRESEFISNNITLNMSLPRLKEKVYWSIFERSFKRQSNEAFLPLIDANQPGSRFAVVVLRLLNPALITERRFRQDKELLYFAAANVMNEMADDKLRTFSFAHPKQEGALITVLRAVSGGREDMAFYAYHKTGTALAMLRDLFGAASLAGIGTIKNDALQLADSYDAAVSAMAAIDLRGLRDGIVAAGESAAEQPDEAQTKDSKLSSLSSRITAIRSSFENGNVNQAANIVGDLLKQWEESDAFTLGEADRTLREFIVLMNDLALEFGVAKGNLPQTGPQADASAGLTLDFGSFDEYASLLYRILDAYSAEIRKAMSAGKPFQIADIKTYIDNHYYEDIKISIFTEKYFLSREYLMKLFKQQFGCGIHEYVQKVRMEKAKRLLDDPALKIQDISEMLGFKDKNYFSKAFRNYFDLSPSEYRAETDKKNEREKK